MSDAAVKKAFEATIERQIQAAYDAVGDNPEISEIVIYMSLEEGWGLSVTMYRAHGSLVEAALLDRVLREPIGSLTDAFQDPLVGEVNAAFEDLLKAYAANPDVDRPTRIVLTFDLASQRFDADFSYRPLSAEIDAPTTIFDRWLAHAQATGHLTADATTVEARTQE